MRLDGIPTPYTPPPSPKPNGHTGLLTKFKTFVKKHMPFVAKLATQAKIIAKKVVKTAIKTAGKVAPKLMSGLQKAAANLSGMLGKLTGSQKSLVLMKLPIIAGVKTQGTNSAKSKRLLGDLFG
jgi:hypothetical protein